MRPTIFCSSLALVLIVTTIVQADALSEITRTIEGKTHRASSGLFDPESNQDAYHIGPGETVTLTTLPGPGEIRHMWFTIAGRDRRYPRALVLRMYWDGADVPSVETPIGDFFAAGNGMRANVNSLPIQVTSYGRALNCYWRMPFRQTARIALTNDGSYPLTVYWQFDWMELLRVPDDMLYFHARYRQEFPAQPFSPYVTIKEANGEDCRFTAYRWHTQAPVIFRQSLKVDIERRSFAEVTNPKTGQRELYDFKYRPDFCSSVALLDTREEALW